MCPQPTFDCKYIVTPIIHFCQIHARDTISDMPNIVNKVSGCQTAPIESFNNFQGNLKKLDKKNLKKLKESIVKKGFTAPLFIWQKNILDGHQRKTALESLKDDGYTIPDVPFVEIEAESEKEAKEILLTYVSQYADVTNSGLEDFIKEAGLNALELDTFTNLDLGTLIANDAKEDDYEPVNVTPRTKLGDIYALGEHRVMCGSSTDKTNVEALMDGKKADMVFTDPPYGGGYQSNKRNKTERFDVLKNDDQFIIDWIPFIADISTGFIFIWSSWKVIARWIEETSILGDMTNLIIWDKGGGGIGDLKGTFSTDFEMALVWNRGNEITGKRIGSVWSIKKDGSMNYAHPTQKPVGLAHLAIQNTTQPENMVLDLFGGSGSTLIACEQLKRKCYIMELDEKYVDVIIDRWEKFTNRKAVKLN